MLVAMRLLVFLLLAVAVLPLLIGDAYRPVSLLFFLSLLSVAAAAILWLLVGIYERLGQRQ